MKMISCSVFQVKLTLLLIIILTVIPLWVFSTPVEGFTTNQPLDRFRSVQWRTSNKTFLGSNYSSPPVPIGVTVSEGTFPDKIRISWDSIVFDHHVYFPLIISSNDDQNSNNDDQNSNNDEIVYYQVFRSLMPLPGDATQLTDYHLISPFDDFSALPGLTYYYWVKACNAAGCSDFSSPASGWRAEAIPSPPTGLSASQGTNAELVHLIWAASETARYYIVYRNNTNSHEGEQALADNVTTCSFDDKNAITDNLYYYWVKACNSAGCSDYSSPASGWIGEIPPPPPITVAASQGSFSDRIIVSWSASVSASYYQVYRSTMENLDHVEQLPGEPETSPYEDVSAQEMTIYYYWVKACNSGGCSDYSAPASGWLTEPLPAAPTDLSASKGTFSDKVRLSWTGSENAMYYQIFRNTGNEQSGQVLIEASHPSTTYDDLSANPGVIYYYWVRACMTTGCSKYSESAQGWRAETLPAPPTGVMASVGHYTDKVLLSWTPSEGAMYYEVYRNAINSHVGATILTSIHPASPYEDTSALSETTYYYWVKACNSVGCSAYSAPDSGWRAMVNIANGDFKAGNDGSWSVESTNNRNLIIHEDFTTITAHSGQYLAWLGGENGETSSISQIINIPPSHPYLHFWYQIQSQDMCDYDYAWVKINGMTLKTFDLCTPKITSDWTAAAVNLTLFSGRAVTLTFEVTTDLSLVSSFYLDDILILSE